jgi:hypothetical protein
LVLGASLVAELTVASLSLPLNRATAPGALTSLRPSVAHLLSHIPESPQQPGDRFLSISDILFDPGDKSEIEMALRPQLSSDAVYDFIIATKQKEVLIPNMALYYRLPTMDGYDGGVLPLDKYVALQRLYMPDGQTAIDGRLREHLDALPEGRWLNLFNVRYVITDKIGDAWFDDVFYDLQMGAKLGAGDEAAVGDVPTVNATALGVVFQADHAAPGHGLADVIVAFSDGSERVLTLNGGSGGPVDQVARLTWGLAATPLSVRFRGIDQLGSVWIRGVSLIDERVDAFWPLVLSDQGHFRRVHSGDVKIYENLDVFPRMVFIEQALTAMDDEAALALMQDPGFDPAQTLVLTEPNASEPEQLPLGDLPATFSSNKIQVLAYRPEHIVASIDAANDGWLLLTDAWYPGWEASVDGVSVPVKHADVLFRAVAVPAGEHQVEWRFRPQTVLAGSLISAAALGVSLLIGAWNVWFWAKGFGDFSSQ